jgi:hypothetical protein
MEPSLLASSSSESSADEGICALHLYNVATLAIIAGAIAKRRISRRKRGGSQPGKAPNLDLDKRQAAIDMDRDNFGRLVTSPVFSNSEVDRRYRMPSCVPKVFSQPVTLAFFIPVFPFLRTLTIMLCNIQRAIIMSSMYPL